LTQNSFPLIKWHEEHMEKLIIKYVTGLPIDASNWQKRMNKKYGKLSNIVKNINYDIKHGANKEQVISLFSRIRKDAFFHDLQVNEESMVRLDNLERELHMFQHTYSIGAVMQSLSSNADSQFGLHSRTTTP
jgi:hypothetical protein